jgi:ribosomal protein S18 acetylase RimI-like enzyme
MSDPILIREAVLDDLDALLALESICFESDRLSRRSFRRWLKGDRGILSVLEFERKVVGYGLVLLHKGTRLARLYSIALSPVVRGRGFGRLLVQALETKAMEAGRLFMRLEVSNVNTAAISLYTNLGYDLFGELPDYYEDHTDALRMQKRICFPGEGLTRR